MLWFIVLYITAAICISFFVYLKCSSRSDYIIGSRKQFANVAGISAQTVLLGFFFTITVPLEVSKQDSGVAGAIIAAAGMVTGIYLSRFLVTRRIRVYSELTGNAISVPEYFENRFNNRSGVLRAVSSAVMLIINVMFAAEILNIAAVILDQFTAMGHVSAVITCALMVSLFIFWGGFSAIVATGYIRAVILLIFFIFILLSGISSPPYDPVFAADSSFFSIAADSLAKTDLGCGILISLAGFVSYSLLFFGVPFINSVFMSTKERRSPRRRILYEFIWTLPCAAGAVILGVIAHATSSVPVTDIGSFVNALTDGTSSLAGALITSLFFIICLATADSAVFSAGTAFSYDLFSHGGKKKTNGKENILINRMGTFIVTVAAVIYAIFSPQNPSLSIPFIMAVIASSFGPLTLFSLYSSSLTAAGAVSSIAAGLIGSSIFNYLAVGAKIPQITAVIPSFAVSSLFLFAVSFFDRKSISKKMRNEFGRAREISKMK